MASDKRKEQEDLYDYMLEAAVYQSLKSASASAAGGSSSSGSTDNTHNSYVEDDYVEDYLE